MSEKKIVFLIPFQETAVKSSCEPQRNPHSFNIQVEVVRHSAELSLTYSIQGPTDDLLIPEQKKQPERKHFLWKHTCYEAFFGWDNNPAYWELNFAPSGDWNLYRFDSYRQGQTMENQISKISATHSVNQIRLGLNLGSLMPPHEELLELRLGISAVIEKKDLSKTYWALTHCAPVPNFHLRESFILKI